MYTPETKYISRLLDAYEKQYPGKGKKTALRMILVSFKALFKYRRTNSPRRPVSAGKKCKTAFLFAGGLGDLVITLNYIAHFHNKFKKYGIEIDLFLLYGKRFLSLSGDFPFINKSSDREKDFFNNYYDLKISCIRFPEIIYSNNKLIGPCFPELSALVQDYKDFHERYDKDFSRHGDYLANNISMANDIKRYAQADIGGRLGIKEKFILQLNTDRYKEILSKFNLTGKKYIVISRESGMCRTNNSTKLWPVEKYRALIEMIRTNLKGWTTVEIGLNPGAAVGNADMLLSGKTDLEELKTIVKYADLLISCEGGPVHLKHALNHGKSVVLFGPTSREIYGYGENVNISGGGCKINCECMTENWEEECISDRHKNICMKSIEPETVFKAVEQALRKA